MIAIPRLSRRKFSVALLVVSICLAAGSVRAQLAPSQPIKIVVGVPAGGLGDLAARVLAQDSTRTDTRRSLKTALVGTGSLRPTRSLNHGRRIPLIMGNHSTLAILPHMIKIGYDPANFAPITLMLAAPNVVIVKATLPVTSMQELVAYGKANRLTNATQGSVRVAISSASSSSNSRELGSFTSIIAARRSHCRTSSPGMST